MENVFSTEIGRLALAKVEWETAVIVRLWNLSREELSRGNAV